ncbi:LysR family transcriptional regulator [Agaribacterium sp. ZY112]|uniref:LysR family transcriptional regulator n=1 Tax=Agaribacterium sp. ZY112 TaxID=3233574 RepID=UPI0035248FA1
MNKTKLLPSMLMFAEVVKQGSFTQAAKQLSMSKSAISQQVSKLEQVLDAQLLSRNTRGLAVTAFGKKLLERCELLQEQVDLTFVALSNAESSPKGEFSLTVPHALERDIAVPALRQLCQEFPGIEPRLVVSDQRLDLVKDKLDIAINAGELKDSCYRAMPIGSSSDMFCASAEYIQRHGQVQTLADIEQHRWITALWQQQKGACIYQQSNNELVHTLAAKHSYRASTLSAVIEMAKQHMGFVLLPDIVSKPLLAEHGFYQLLPQYRGPSWPFYLLHNYQTDKPQYVNRFYQLVCHYFAKAQA